MLAERHIDTNGKIPLIFPVVVYAGTAKYTAPRNLWALFEHPELAKKILTEDHALVDLQSMSDSEIAKKKHIALFEYVLKHIHMRDMMKLWKNIFEKFPEAVLIDKKHGYLYITNLLWYIDGKLSVEKRDELSNLIIEHLPQEDGEEIMKTIADSYREEGVHKGMLIGKNEGIAIGKNKGIAIGKNEGIAIGKNEGIAIGTKKIVMRMLQANTDVKYISSVTGLTIDEILKFKNEI